MKTLLYGWDLADQLTEVNILAVIVAMLFVAVIYLLIKSKRHSEREVQLDTFIKDMCKVEHDFTKSEAEKLKTEIKLKYDILSLKINELNTNIHFEAMRTNAIEKIIHDLQPPLGSEKITHKRNNKGQFEKLT